MKKKSALKYLFATMIVLFTLAGALMGSMAWFVTIVSIDDANIKGSSAGAYFAYGNGKSLTYSEGDVNRPFGITLPRHFYNLAWLQYMGEFKDDQYYFELANDIDMTGYVLPPIGTTKYPFVSYFNGNGHVISNLTVSSDKDELFSSARHPDVTSVNYTDPEIIGLFGVVGNLDDGSGAYSYEGTYSSSINQITDLGVSGITVKSSTEKVLAGMVAGYVDATIKNVAVNDSTINITDEDTACVNSSWTSNVSDFGSVGYATKEHKKSIKKVEEDIYDVNITSEVEYNAKEGDDNGFGGSINMKTIYNRIVSLRRAKGTDVSDYGNGTANWRIEKNYFNNTLKETVNHSNVERTNNTNDAYSRYNGFNESGHEYIGSYNIYARSAANGYPNSLSTDDKNTYGDQQFLYLCGGHRENRTYNTYYTHSGRYITDGTNYLTYNGSSLGNTTSDSDATLWNFTAYSGSVYYITTQYNNTTYYLYYNSGSLGITTGTGETSRWLVDDSGTYRDIKYNGNANYHLTYNSGWTLINTNTAYYVIYDGNNHYFKAPTGTTVLSGGEADAALFTYTSSTFYLNGTRLSTNGDNANAVIISSNGNKWTFSGTPSSTIGTAVSGTFSYTSGFLWFTTTYYISYSGANASYPWIRNTSSGTTLYVKRVNPFTASLTKTSDLGTPKQGPDYYKSSETTGMYYTATDTTYLPLNVDSDLKSYISNAADVNSEISSGHLDPKPSNTGYIISGSNIDPNLPQFTRVSSNIRISRYAISSVQPSYNKTSGSSTTPSDLSDSNIRTIDTSGALKTMDDFDYTNVKTSIYTRYADSKDSLFKNSLANSTDEGRTFKTNAYIYGLHFMDSAISKDSIVNASKVNVLGNKCDSYQFPVDCIDFNLKQKGFVNFFAGAYYSDENSDNNSFFSLHQIFRNDDAVQKVEEGEPVEGEYASYNTISDIKEIDEIYVHKDDKGLKNTRYSVIYKYKLKAGETDDEMYSVPYRSFGGKKYVMDPDDATDSSELYSYDTMGTTDFNKYVTTYGYNLRFKTDQIGVLPSTSISKNNYIYYFEFPMNDGEYCLGSVPNGTGAYLLYLDIGANAALTQRTMAYEHFKEINKLFHYPEGVAVISTAVVATNKAGGNDIDETDTSNFVIYAGADGTVTVSRIDNDVTLTRASGFTDNAKPTLVGDNMWDDERHEYMIHDPGSNNLTDEISPITTITESTRLTLLDYNVVASELTKTAITDTEVYVSATGKNVSGTHYYVAGESNGGMREVTFADLPSGKVSVSGMYYDDNGTIRSAAGTNVHGTHYYADSAGNTEKVLADVATDTVDVSKYCIKTTSQAFECHGNNAHGVHYYTDAACTSEVMLSNLPTDTISVVGYYVASGEDTFVSATGNNVNGTTYYLNPDGTKPVSLADLPNSTVSVEGYYSKVDAGRTVIQYYEDGSYETDVESISMFNNSGVRYSPDEILDSETVATVKDGTINNDIVIRFEYVEENGVNVSIEYVFQKADDESLSPKIYYLFDGYVVEINVVGDELVITILENNSGEEITITIKDPNTNGTEDAGSAGTTITIPLPPPPTPTPTA